MRDARQESGYSLDSAHVLSDAFRGPAEMACFRHEYGFEAGRLKGSIRSKNASGNASGDASEARVLSRLRAGPWSGRIAPQLGASCRRRPWLAGFSLYREAAANGCAKPRDRVPRQHPAWRKRICVRSIETSACTWQSSAGCRDTPLNARADSSAMQAWSTTWRRATQAAACW